MQESMDPTEAIAGSQHPSHDRDSDLAEIHGCKAGAACSFSHEAAANAPKSGNEPIRPHKQGSPSSLTPVPIHHRSNGSRETSQVIGTGRSDEQPNSSDSRVAPPTEKRVFQPIPETQRADPRQFQLNQLRRRFSPEEKEVHEATALTFRLVPTDPDFPFEMMALQCTLLVPHSYPTRGRPSLRVTNPEMDRGYQINVERGFDSLVTTMSKSTLLALMNELDKRLEGFLVSEKAQTIKLVTNTGKGPSNIALRSTAPPAQPAAISSEKEPSSISSPPQHSSQKISEAAVKRESDIRQLEARMGRQPHFSKSPGGLSFFVPLQISQLSKLPVSLQPLKSVRLFVPLLYNLEPCSISLVDVSSKEADTVQAAFRSHATAHPEMTLMAHVNHLAQNLHTMAIEAPAAATTPRSPPLAPSPSTEPPVRTSKDVGIDQEEDRPHIHIIPRPPEWDRPRDDIDQNSSGTDGSEFESSEYGTDDDGGAAVPAEARVGTDIGPDLGILLSFPSLALYGAELLQLFSISLTLKCDRCKEMKDVKSVKSYTPADTSLIKHESCNKCAAQLSIGYRSELMHPTSVRAGHLDLDGCSIVDLLPSNFIPTCSQCSTPYPAPGVVSFRGESTMVMCRECHQKMSFKIPDVKFLRVSAAGVGKNRPLPRKRPKENLGIVSGQELPRRGRCQHYAKSYRWFRFSCCSKVYPCDRCHDATEEHPNEHANRMICGFCSREQIYRPEDCIHCHSSVIRKHGGGFWEGGKGTRDKVRMNRKDPRKYKRRPGGTVGGGGKDKTKK
ncbi:hypothetical protein EPUS_00679 [Endocarpon pusillum Z07020]|uniref:CHY-type domain-containing protein n=1 Tax=Endocarpon pusillum (strain Z07020 / HMAS-L-300199) TaxID=1263415 RepID=U1HYG8_ENDPU|nr:uncharacterized protein EPUS_00679 [Endocarpon pusillum Z07020]ERF74549.1 hypothetical protein EPUS_00679 [Endocarpon pusillum Z07020]